jgi:hemerythrin
MLMTTEHHTTTGHSIIDAEHAEIFALGTQFKNNPTPTLARELIATILSHLSNEEREMYMIDLDEALLHSVSHNIFRRHLVEILNSIDDDFAEASIALEHAVFGLFKNHATGRDAAFIRYHQSELAIKH